MSSAMHLVFPFLHHVLGAHMQRLRQVFLRHRSTLDVCALAGCTLLELLGLVAPTGVLSVGLGAHDGWGVALRNVVALMTTSVWALRGMRLRLNL